MAESLPKWKQRLWTMIDNPEGLRFTNSASRYQVVAAGRRSGKSERGKRKFLKRVMQGSKFPNPRFIVCAPTQGQVKKIYWQDFKAMIPPQLILGKPNETELSIDLVTGVRIELAGLDNPARIEGAPVDYFLFDEVDDVKRSAWHEHVFPCFADRKAGAIFVGVPNGLGYLYDLSKRAVTQPDLWDFFTWKSEEVLDPEEIANFKGMMDERTYRQEFEASFETFSGRVYYSFSRENYKHELMYDPSKPLIFCFDFNASPGVAAVCQEQIMPNQFEDVCVNGVWRKEPVIGTGVIGEVWVTRDSNTEIVCRRLYEDWGEHRGNIICYGDAAGGNRTSSGVRGSDWDLIKNFFKQTSFCDRISYKVPRANPRVRARVNAVNSRCKSMTGVIRFMIDAETAPHTVDDFEKTTILAGSAGEIDKKKDSSLTHLSDALGYYIHKEFCVENNKSTAKEFLL